MHLEWWGRGTALGRCEGANGWEAIPIKMQKFACVTVKGGGGGGGEGRDGGCCNFVEKQGIKQVTPLYVKY